MDLNKLLNEKEVKESFEYRIKRDLREILSGTYSTHDEFSNAIRDAISDKLSSYMKKPEFNDMLQNALNKYITEDVAEKIIEKGVEQYTQTRGRW